jgi:hypothetical protein
MMHVHGSWTVQFISLADLATKKCLKENKFLISAMCFLVKYPSQLFLLHLSTYWRFTCCWLMPITSVWNLHSCAGHSSSHFISCKVEARESKHSYRITTIMLYHLLYTLNWAVPFILLQDLSSVWTTLPYFIQDLPSLNPNQDQLSWQVFQVILKICG